MHGQQNISIFLNLLQWINPLNLSTTVTVHLQEAWTVAVVETCRGLIHCNKLSKESAFFGLHYASISRCTVQRVWYKIDLYIRYILFVILTQTEKAAFRKTGFIFTVIVVMAEFTACYIEHNINTNKWILIFWCRLIERYSPTCFAHLCEHLQGGMNKNTIIITEVLEPFNHLR
jgi:hypothetical protein